MSQLGRIRAGIGHGDFNWTGAADQSAALPTISVGASAQTVWGSVPPAGMPSGYSRGDFNPSAILFSAFPHEDFTDLTPATLESDLIANAYGFNNANYTTTELVSAPSTKDGGAGRYLWVQTNPVLGKEFVCQQGAYATGTAGADIGPGTIKHFASLGAGEDDVWVRVVWRVAGAEGAAHQAPPTPTPLGALITDEFGNKTGDYAGGDAGYHAFSNAQADRNSFSTGSGGPSQPPLLYAGTGGNGTFTISPDPGFGVDAHAGKAILLLGSGYSPGTSLPPASPGLAAPYERAHVIIGGQGPEAQALYGSGGGHVSVTSNTTDTLTFTGNATGATHVVIGGWFQGRSWKTLFASHATGNVRIQFENDFGLNLTEPAFITGPTTSLEYHPGNVSTPPVGSLGAAVDYNSHKRAQNNHSGDLAFFFTRSDYIETLMHCVRTDPVAHDGFRDVFMRRLTVSGAWSPDRWKWHRHERLGGTNSFPIVNVTAYNNRNGPSDRVQYFCTAQMVVLDGSVDPDPFGVYADLGLPATSPYGSPGDPTT